MFGQPVVVLEAGAEVLTAAHGRAVGRGLPVSVFTEELFAAGHDAADRAAVAAVLRAGLALVGFGVHGPRNAVDEVVEGARMHP